MPINSTKNGPNVFDVFIEHSARHRVSCKENSDFFGRHRSDGREMIGRRFVLSVRGTFGRTRFARDPYRSDMVGGEGPLQNRTVRF